MFVQPPKGVRSRLIAVTVDGEEVLIPEGSSAALAAMQASPTGTRRSPATGQARAPYCMMGACFECLLEIDGVPSLQGCLIVVRPGMTICRPQGAREIPDA